MRCGGPGPRNRYTLHKQRHRQTLHSSVCRCLRLFDCSALFGAGQEQEKHGRTVRQINNGVESAGIKLIIFWKIDPKSEVAVPTPDEDQPR